MWKLYASKNKPFWAIQNGNKPSKAVFDKYIETLEEISGNLNFVDFFTAEYVDKANSYQYFKVVNEENGDTKYYYTTATKIVQRTSYVYLLNLDIYATYTNNWIERNKDSILTFNRTHNYTNEVSTVGDTVIDVIPKAYDEINMVKFNYANSTDGENNFYYNESFGFKNPENNAYKYYVFNDGPNGTYTLIPCVNNSSVLEFYSKGTSQGDLVYTGYFNNGDYKYKKNNREYNTNISADLNTKIIDAYKNGKIVKYFARNLNDRVNWVELTGWSNIKVVHNTMPKDFYMTGFYETQTPGFDGVGYTISANGSQIFTKYCDGITAGNWDSAWSRLKQLSQFKVEIYNTIRTDAKPVNVYNNKQNIEDTVITNSSFTNKFVGIFAGPNLLSFPEESINFQDISNKKFITISLPATGIKIPQYGIYRYVYRNIDGINNDNLGYEYSLKYLNVNYYNNNINAVLRSNTQNLILLSGNLVFSNGFYLLDKTSDLLSLANSIIYFGGELPNSKDTYKQYVNSQRNSLDTSYSIKRQEASISNLQAGINGGINAAKKVAEIAAAVATAGASSALSAATSTNAAAMTAKNDLNAIGTTQNIASSSMGIVGDLAGVGLNIWNTERQLSNYRTQVAAQFADANLTMGNQINMSSAQDASLMCYLESNGEQYEVVEVLNLSPQSNIVVNNYLYLNGFYFPHPSTFSRFLDVNRKFNYVEIDYLTLNNYINLNVDNIPLNVLELVKTQLINGIRIWNTDKIELPDNLIEDLPQTNPGYENTPITPPSTDIPPWNPDPDALIDINVNVFDRTVIRIKTREIEVYEANNQSSTTKTYPLKKNSNLILNGECSNLNIYLTADENAGYNINFTSSATNAYFNILSNTTTTNVSYNNNSIYKFIDCKDTETLIQVNMSYEFNIIQNLNIKPYLANKSGTITCSAYIENCPSVLIYNNFGVKPILDLYYKGTKPEVKFANSKITVNLIEVD